VNQSPLQPPVLRARDAAPYLGIALSTLWWKARTDPDFPKPRKLSARTTVWSRAELDAYLMRAGVAA